MASATVSCMCSSLTPRRVGSRKWGVNRSKHHKNRSNVVTFYAPNIKTTHDPKTRNTNGTTQLFSKQNLAWWSHYPKLLPHKKQSLGSCGLRLRKGLKQTALGSAVSCVASTLFFSVSQLTQAQTQQNLPFRQRIKHILFIQLRMRWEAEDIMKEEVHKCTWVCRGPGNMVSVWGFNSISWPFLSNSS